MMRPDQTNSSFDQWLDGKVSGKSTSADETSNDAPDSHQLREAASQFHDLAASSDRLTGDPATTERLDHIWENVMMKTALASPVPTAGISSGSTNAPIPIGRANPLVSRRRWPVVVNAFVAAALVLGLSFGIWQTYQGLNGGGNDPKSTEFSAFLQATAESEGTPQVMNWNGTPVLAPDLGVIDMPVAQDCTVEPLTVDQVLGYVDAPYTPNGGPDQADRMKGSGSETLAYDYSGEPPELVFSQITELQREWSACVQAGSWMQLFALLDSRALYSIVIELLYPTYLTREEGRAIIEALESTGRGGPNNSTATDFFNGFRIALVSPDPKKSWMDGPSLVRSEILVFSLDGTLTNVYAVPDPGQGTTYDYIWNDNSKRWMMYHVEIGMG